MWKGLPRRWQGRGFAHQAMGEAPNHPQKKSRRGVHLGGTVDLLLKITQNSGQLRSQIDNALGNIVLLACEAQKMQSAMQSAISFISSTAHAAGGDGGGADAHAGGHKGAALLAGHGVLVGGDVHLVQVVLQLLAGALLVGAGRSAAGGCPCRRRPASRRGAVSSAASAFAFSTILLAYSLNSGFSASPKHTAFAAMTCSSGPPCVPGKMAELMRLDEILVVGQDQAAAGAAQRLVGGGGHHVGVGDRVLVLAALLPDRQCGPYPPSASRRSSWAISASFSKSMARG